MDSEKKLFLKNFIWNSLGTGINSFNSLFFLIIVTRVNDIQTAGIFSIAYATATILYTLAMYSGRLCQVTDIKNKIKDKKVKDIMSMPVLIKQDTNIYDSIVTMFLSDVGSIFIIDDSENLCGIVSRKDLLKATIGSADINKMPIGMIMTRTPNVITANKEDDVILATKKIIEHEVDSIPVVEINKEDTNHIKVIGRLSKTNITKLFLEIADN